MITLSIAQLLQLQASSTLRTGRDIGVTAMVGRYVVELCQLRMLYWLVDYIDCE